ncbi:hypothetical protein BO221_06930 [Archangium sp. Cb G35]|uniref:hypothetical protein n=1 Tax=Archangium sp. Cb G35 TaxID=1920190 RepID=UPI000936E350|nr:hypothetical protein [Archangium sp. Cb G35]OJT25600.1 hypothetical protein BO221_06930 [Archangium sp. Cb G35]
MRLPASLPSCLASLSLLGAVLAPPQAFSRPLHESPLSARARGIPAALSLLPHQNVPNQNVEFPAIPVQPEPPEASPDVEKTPPPEKTERTSPHLTATDAPVTPGAWVTYGAAALAPLGGVYGASRLGEERLWVTATETVAGSLTGALPAQLLFLQSADAGGRWAELDVAAFGAGLVLTPPLAALGTWGLGELAFDGSQDRGRAFLGALGGAAVGTLLGVAVHGLLEEVVDNRSTLGWFRKYIALGFIGSGATVGYQWAGGGPRARPQ